MAKPVPTMYQQLGNFPATHVTYYQGKKPELSLTSEQRAMYLGFKVEEKDNRKRESMAIIVNKLPYANIIHGSDKGAEFIQSLVDEAQDSQGKQVAAGKAKFETVQDYAELVREYFDNTRTASGNRVSAEVVGTFFDATLLDWLMEQIATKFQQFSAEQVAKVAAQYRQSFCNLSSYQLPHTKAVAEMINRAWSKFLAENSDKEFDEDMADWINQRLKKLMDKHSEFEMMVDAI